MLYFTGWASTLFFFCQITDLRQRLAESQKTVLELEAEREQRQRDYDKKLLLAKSKIENVQVRTPRHKPCGRLQAAA